MNIILKALVTSALMFSVYGSHAVTKESFSTNVDKHGNITLPNNFRNEMVHLGSWFVPEGGASGFHDVYTEKASVEYYRINNKFPDGATIVKELRASHAGSYTTGKNVNYANNVLKQWFVMVKDSEGRFANNPLWGDGWGWALYKPDIKEGGKFKNVATDYKTDCLGCHIPAKQNDWIYTEAYPSLNTER
jgi:hypothetical protein